MHCNWWIGKKKDKSSIVLSFCQCVGILDENKWSCLKINEDGDVVNKTIVSIQEIITETINSKEEKEDLASEEPNNKEGKGIVMYL